MYKFNQLEKLLDAIVDGKKSDDENPNLTFDLGDYLLIFSRDEGSYMCYLDCVAHDNYDRKSANYNKKFEFELPLIYINYFLMKHINESQINTHFLLTFPPAYNMEPLEEVYTALIEKINSEPDFFPAFLPGVLNKEMPINEDKLANKKLKI
jgi:hypothetical protein